MENNVLPQYDDKLKDLTMKIASLKDEYDSVGSAIADLTEKQRELLSEKSEYIVKNRIFGDDNAYAIAYSPIEIGGCGELLRTFVLCKSTPNAAYSGIFGSSLLYRYFDGKYMLSIERTFISSSTHEEYEKERLVYRISTEEGYDKMLIALSKKDFSLEDIHKYLDDNFIKQEIV